MKPNGLARTLPGDGGFWELNRGEFGSESGGTSRCEVEYACAASLLLP